MVEQSLLYFIKKLNRPVFTTSELCALSGKSASTVTQGLNYLAGEGLIFKIYRGIWAEAKNERVSQYSVIPFLFPKLRAYVSFVSALHLYGIIEQIPQVITLASTAHTRTIRTKIANFSVHQLAPSFFSGFQWYRETGDFLIAEPEKALVDSLYLAAHKKKQFRYFPELRFPKSFSFRKVKQWVEAIPHRKTRYYVQKKVGELLEGSSTDRD